MERHLTESVSNRKVTPDWGGGGHGKTRDQKKRVVILTLFIVLVPRWQQLPNIDYLHEWEQAFVSPISLSW